MYSEKTKEKYLELVFALREESRKMWTLAQWADHLEVSKPTLIKFFKGRSIRFDLLERISELTRFGEFDFEVTKK
jgi:hypothetical protein